MTDTKTLTYSRTLPAAPARVAQALTDPAARMAWGPPDADSVVQIEGQPVPAPGVRDIARAGPRDNPYVDVTTDWIEISDSRVTYAESLAAEGEAFATSFAVLSLSAQGTQTQLDATIFVASFAGAEVLPEVEGGWVHALDALARHLS